MKKQKEVVCQIRMGEGMKTVCGTHIQTVLDKKGIPSYNPKYTLSRGVTCKDCLYISKIHKKYPTDKLAKEFSLGKPKPPIEPQWKDYQTPKISNGKNHLGEPLYQKLDWVRDYNKYKKDFEKYEEQLEVYEQLKLIRFIKNADEKLILKKYKITKK